MAWDHPKYGNGWKMKMALLQRMVVWILRFFPGGSYVEEIFLSKQIMKTTIGIMTKTPFGWFLQHSSSFWNIQAVSSSSSFSSLFVTKENVQAVSITIFSATLFKFFYLFAVSHSNPSNMSRHPTLKWAQRSDKIYLTVELPDAQDVKLKLEPEGKFNFSATKDGLPYEIDIELFDKINTEESKVNTGMRNIMYVIKKAEKKWWSRLLKQEGKPPVFLKVDWDKWIDEDDENEKSAMDFDDMDFSNLNLGGDDFDGPQDDEEGIEEQEEETDKEENEPAAAGSEEAKA